MTFSLFSNDNTNIIVSRKASSHLRGCPWVDRVIRECREVDRAIRECQVVLRADVDFSGYFSGCQGIAWAFRVYHQWISGCRQGMSGLVQGINWGMSGIIL